MQRLIKIELEFNKRVDFITKNITRDKDDYFIVTKVSIPQKT